MYMDYQERLSKLEDAQKENEGEDSQMTEDVDWFDFVVVEQIELYNDEEMTQQLQSVSEAEKQVQQSAII